MAKTVNQPTALPTNKLSAATTATAIMSVAGLVVQNIWPSWYSQEVWAAMLPVVVFVVGWFVSDAPNVPVEGE